MSNAGCEEVAVNNCEECGMPVMRGYQYHPYAACLMFKGCHDSFTVQANLDAVIAYGLNYENPELENARAEIERLTAEVDSQRAEIEGLRKVLESAQKAIESVPEDTFGFASFTDSMGDECRYPIRAELSQEIISALASADKGQER